MQHDNDIGQKLREARESAGFSRRDVATTLFIREEYIVAIEEGRLEAIPGAVYARGYIRKYAAFLGFAADAFQQPAIEEKPLPERRSSVSRSVHPGKLSKPLVLACLACVLLVVVWQAMQNGNQEKPLNVRPLPEEMFDYTSRTNLDACREDKADHSFYPPCYASQEDKILLNPPPLNSVLELAEPLRLW